MRKSFVILVELAVVATFLLTPLTAAADSHKVRGTIVAVDLATSSLTVKTANMQNATCIVDAQTNITISGKTAALVDLKVGQNAALEVQAGKALTIVVSEN
jgi:hypothetical protein